MSVTLCRDCLNIKTALIQRCDSCHSDRVLNHNELQSLTLAHVDCDAFYAAVEKRDNPDLRNVPVIVGYDGGRGVVTTACYIARRYGPRSAMPMFKAMKMCPEAVIIPPDMTKYRSISQQVRQIFSSFTSNIEPVSLDEAYLDLSEDFCSSDQSAAHCLAEIASRIESEIGITVSLGLSYNKFLAKLASDLEKPRGFSVVGTENVREFISPLSIRRINGVGQVTARQLEDSDITTIGDLQRLSESELAIKFGKFGRQLSRFSNGKDNRQVSNHRYSKSVSNETTFRQDISDEHRLIKFLEPLCEKVATRLQRKSVAGGTVVLKLKTADFQLITRNFKLAHPTQRAEILFKSALPLLRREADGRSFRLIGVGVSQLCPAIEADPPDLFDNN